MNNKETTNRILIGAVGFLSVAILCMMAVGYSWHGNRVKIISINGHYLRAEIVSTREKLTLGLGNRNQLCARCAMLFVFPQSRPRAFWMKGMRFPLDIIWIHEGKIVAIEKNIPADSKETFMPQDPADQVLEVNAGLVEQHHWAIGDQLSFR